jgi:hypothetical protein
VILLVALACHPEPGPTGPGLIGDHPLNPFPVGVLHTTDGRIDLDPADFDLGPDLTPLRTERFRWREGFSVGQTSVVVLPGSVDVAALPSWRDPTPGEGGVRLFDRTDGAWLPVMAELDAHPDAVEGTVLVRPLQALTPGHDVAVVLTTALTSPVPHFQALFTEAPPEQLVPHVAHFEDLVEQLDGAGLPRDEVALAWDFPVADGTAPLRSAWAQTAAPTAFDLTVEGDADTTDDLPPFAHRVATGTFTTTDFLIDDLALDLQPDGSVAPTGSVAVDLYVHVPSSVADAPAGSAPVLIFGHGIFATPELYLDSRSDEHAVLRVAERLGAVVLAIRWRGLTTPDLAGATAAGADFTRIHEVTDRLVQAQANLASLTAALEQTDLLQDPVFHNRSGEPVVDPDRLLYYGISLGAIEGAVYLANDPPVDHVVLHVGGGVWSTMLERSSNWPTFELLLERTVPDPVTRQRLYAVSQLWWDPVDPLSYTRDLASRDALLQEAIGDQQVPNLSTRQFARSAGFTLLEPVHEEVHAIPTRAGPVQEGLVLVQIDPEEPLPDDVNRPAGFTSAHEIPRTLPGVIDQTVLHLTSGETVHPCGASVCSPSNPGDP